MSDRVAAVTLLWPSYKSQERGKIPPPVPPLRLPSAPLPLPAPSARPAESPATNDGTGPRGLRSNSHLVGVRGWLLLLCISLTILGPLVAVGTTVRGYEKMRPNFSSVAGLENFDGSFSRTHLLQYCP
jgi:hypothetical protein